MEGAPWCRRVPQRWRCVGSPQLILVGITVVNVYCNYICVTKFYILCWSADASAAFPALSLWLMDMGRYRGNPWLPPPHPRSWDVDTTCRLETAMLLRHCPWRAKTVRDCIHALRYLSCSSCIKCPHIISLALYRVPMHCSPVSCPSHYIPCIMFSYVAPNASHVLTLCSLIYIIFPCRFPRASCPMHCSFQSYSFILFRCAMSLALYSLCHIALLCSSIWCSLALFLLPCYMHWSFINILFVTFPCFPCAVSHALFISSSFSALSTCTMLPRFVS